MRTLFLFALCAVLAASSGAQELFTLSWGEGNAQVGLRTVEIDDPCHHGMPFRYGPTAIAVNSDQTELFVLDRVRGRVLVLDMQGNFLRSHSVDPGLWGLAVSGSGALVAFSPTEKYALGLTGSLNGRRMEAPQHFSALSEVWFVGDKLFGRYGWQAARLDAVESRNEPVFCRAALAGDCRVAVEAAGAQAVLLDIPREIANSYASGAVLDGRSMLLTLVCPPSPEHERGQTLVLRCDAAGNCSDTVELAAPWAQSFCTSACLPDGTLYEMRIEERGVSIVRHHALKEMGRSLRSRDSMPAEEAFPQFGTAREEGSRATVNVWFRDSNTIRTMNLEDYIKGVVSQEIYGTWLLEAHRSMAVAARTYAVARYRHPGTNPPAHVCNTTCCQAWTAHPTAKGIQGTNDTAGQYVVNGSKRITEPLYFSHCNGRTKNSEDHNGWNYVAYLRSRPCSCGWTSYYGHGVGMCQYGMEAYAKQGWSYRQIIAHYYTNCSVGN